MAGTSQVNWEGVTSVVSAMVAVIAVIVLVVKLGAEKGSLITASAERVTGMMRKQMDEQEERLAIQEGKIDCLEKQIRAQDRKISRLELHLRLAVEKVRMYYFQLKEAGLTPEPLPDFLEAYQREEERNS
ncbi:MAG: hypothetical protein HPY85_06800 [Anaerolineae bacterium]|nr:hypothetical protein [Anaerolineae bacterium]